MTVAEMIRETRVGANLTQEEYGLKFGVSRQTVSSWENGRSMPDLQMLIDICNVYHISLDKLLREDQDFVSRITFYGKVQKALKYAAVILLLAIVVFAAVFIRWNMTAADKNEAFSQRAAELGFTLQNGQYRMEKNGVAYELPNQKLPFMKDHFYNQTSWAELRIKDTEVVITIYEDETAEIRVDNYRGVKGRFAENGTFETAENSLSGEEEAFLAANRGSVRNALRQLFAIHSTVYAE